MTSKPTKKPLKKVDKAAALPRRPGSTLRRIRYGFQAVAMLLAISAVVGFLGVLSDRYAVVVDATSSRVHQLSDRTRSLLRGLREPHEVLIVANLSGVEPRAIERTQDVLDGFARETDQLRISVIDITSSSGLRDLDATLERVVSTYKPSIDRTRTAIDAAANTVSELAVALEPIGNSMTAAAGKVADDAANAAAIKQFLTDSGSLCRIAATDAQSGAQASRTAMDQTISRTPVPSLDTAVAQARRTIVGLHLQLSQLIASLDSVVRATDDQVPASVRDEIRPLTDAVIRLRDRAAQQIASLDDVPRFPLATAARAVGESSAALIIGPPRDQAAGSTPAITAVEIEALFPRRIPGVSDKAPVPDVRARAEELLAGAIAAVNADDAPIVIITHGASEAERLAPDFTPMAAMVDRLRLRGMIILEWAAALDAEPPSIAAVDPTGKRPVVFVVMPTSGMTPEGAARMIKLAAAIRALVESGRPVLLSVTPSTLPSIGQKDPQVDALEALGMKVDSARPLLRQSQTPAGPIVAADFIITSTGADHPIAGSIESLRTHLPWCTPIRVDAGIKRVLPIIMVPDDNRTWAESEWLRFRQTPANQRPLLANPPQEDSARDDGNGPWMIAAAVERTLPDQRKQRIVAVGSSGWFLDDLTQQRITIGAQTVPVCPGNLELLEASIYWLAGQNDMIARSPQAQSLPTIPTMDATQSAAIRWGLIAGLPLLVLLLGGVWRMIRG